MPAPARLSGTPNGSDHYRRLVELSPDAILVHDGIEVIFGNAAALRLAGANHPDELVGLPVDRLLAPPYFRSIAARLTGSAGPADLTAPVRDTFRRLDGSTVEVEVRAVAFMADGRPTAHLVLRDITERLAGEQALQELTERLHQVNRLEAIGTLAGGVAHEVNNMMAVVRGFGESILREAGLPTGCRADVAEILIAAERAAQVTRHLLAFSRSATHQPRAVDLGVALADAAALVRPQLGPTHRLVVETVGAPVVRIDPAQFQELIGILALNARDAMPDGGTLTLTAMTATLPDPRPAADGRIIPAGRQAVVTVQDTGIGMDEAVQARLFEPFFTTRPQGTGTGLGLAAALGILVQHAGFVTVSTAPGAGATFTLYLPILPRQTLSTRGEEPWRADAADPVHGATVLLVDDEPALLAITARTLVRSGYRVLEASSGEEALTIVDRVGPPDLVLTDLSMPGIGGVELTRQLRERWTTLPILFMSGFSTEDVRQTEDATDRFEVMEKPFSMTELPDRVAATLRRAQAAGAGAG